MMQQQLLKCCFCLVSVAFVCGSLSAASQVPLAAVDAGKGHADDVRHADAIHNGQRDFDFDLGNWKTHSSRLLHPLTGSKDWVDMDGSTIVKKIWGGRASLAEFKSDGAAGQLQLLSLRWYNPNSRQWYLDFATPNVGKLGEVPAVGEFRNGRGDFYDRESIGGRTILLRFSIWGITADTAQSEQAFSDDGGKTWEVNWTNRYTRMSE
jgi:hypothetical protein